MAEQSQQRTPAQALGAYLHSLRTGRGLSLREVEEASGKAVSNAYLSQLENGKIAKPSPHVLHHLALVYDADYQKLMARAGYIAPDAERSAEARHGRAATYAIEHLTAEEEQALLDYLAFIRARKGRP